LTAGDAPEANGLSLGGFGGGGGKLVAGGLTEGAVVGDEPNGGVDGALGLPESIGAEAGAGPVLCGSPVAGTAVATPGTFINA